MGRNTVKINHAPWGAVAAARMICDRSAAKPARQQRRRVLP